MIKLPVNSARGERQLRQGIVNEFIIRANERLQGNNRTDMEIEIPSSVDNDKLWDAIWSAADAASIVLSTQEVDKTHDPHYYYLYIRKRNLD